MLWILISLFLKNGNRRGTWTLYLNISYVQNVWLSGNTPVCIRIFVGRQDTLTIFLFGTESTPIHWLAQLCTQSGGFSRLIKRPKLNVTTQVRLCPMLQCVELHVTFFILSYFNARITSLFFCLDNRYLEDKNVIPYVCLANNKVMWWKILGKVLN